MTASEFFQRLATRFPEGCPQITELPTGALLFDITIGTDRWCAEFFPSDNAYGLSKIAGASPFWEGVNESFTIPDELERRIAGMMKLKH